MIRTVIIEDETAAQKLLTAILKQCCPEVEIIGYGEDIQTSVQLIEETKPDLILMDIEIIGGSSFEILENLMFKSFHLIFTTAYDEYALKAFKYEAIDYIVKPYYPKDIRKAIDRISKKAKFDEIEKQNLMKLKSKRSSNKICIPTEESIEFIELDHIIRIEADRSYCTIYLLNEKHLTISKPLKDMEQELPSNQFFRPHQSHIINFDFISRYLKEDGGLILLKNGESIPLARRRKQAFLELIS